MKIIIKFLIVCFLVLSPALSVASEQNDLHKLRQELNIYKKQLPKILREETNLKTKQEYVEKVLVLRKKILSVEEENKKSKKAPVLVLNEIKPSFSSEEALGSIKVHHENNQLGFTAYLYDDTQYSLKIIHLPEIINTGQPFDIEIEARQHVIHNQSVSCNMWGDKCKVKACTHDLKGMELRFDANVGSLLTLSTSSTSFDATCSELNSRGVSTTVKNISKEEALRRRGVVHKEDTLKLSLHFTPEEAHTYVETRYTSPDGNYGILYEYNYNVQVSTNGMTKKEQVHNALGHLTFAQFGKTKKPDFTKLVKGSYNNELFMSFGVNVRNHPIHLTIKYVLQVSDESNIKTVPYSHPPVPVLPSKSGGENQSDADENDTDQPKPEVPKPNQTKPDQPKPKKPKLDPNKPNSINPDDPKVAVLIQQWISSAEPPMNATDGANARYEPYGRWVGEGINGIRGKVTANPDDVAGRTPEKYVWDKRDKLDSVNHCTLGEYVIAKLKNDSIDHCKGRYKPRVNAMNKKQAEELLQNARKLWKRGRLGSAISQVNKAQKLVPNDKKIEKTLTAMQRQKQELDKRLKKVFERVRNNQLKEAERILGGAAVINDKYPRYKRAKQKLENAKIKAKEDKKRNKLAEGLLKKAKDLWKRGNLSEAIKTAKKASQTVPKNVKIAKIHQAMKSQKKIIDKRLKKVFDDIRKKRLKDAEATLARAAVINDKYPRYKRAKQKLENAKIKAKEDRKRIKQAEGLLKKAKDLWKKGALSKAIETAQKASQIVPKDTKIAKTVIVMQKQKKSMDNALSECDTHIGRGAFKKAENTLKKAGRISSNYPPFIKMKDKLKRVKVADVVGLNKKQAENKLKEIGLKTRITLGDAAPTKRDGLKVQKSIPKAGTTIKRGSTVTLVVHPPFVDKRTVPSLIGFTEKEVIKKIKSIGLIPKITKVKASSTAQSGKVSKIDPYPGTEVVAGTVIYVDVFDTFDDRVIVPNVIGLGMKEAAKKIKKAGFKPLLILGDSTEDRSKDKTITEQKPKAGAKIILGTEIEMIVQRYKKIIPKPSPTKKQVYCALGKSGFIYKPDMNYYVFRSYELKENRRHFRREYKIFANYKKTTSQGTVEVGLQRAQKIQAEGKMEFIMKAPLKELCPHLKKNCHTAEPFVGDLCGKLDGSAIPSNGIHSEKEQEINPGGKIAFSDSFEDFGGGKSTVAAAKCERYNKCLAEMMQEIQHFSLKMASSQGLSFMCKYLGLGQAMVKVSKDANSAGCKIAGNYEQSGDMIKATAGQMCKGQIIAFDINKLSSCTKLGKKSNVQDQNKPNWDNGCNNGNNTSGAILQWTLRDPPPYSGLTPICSDRNGKLWILNNHISQIVKGKRDRFGCYYGSTVKAKNRNYGGTLCRPK